ncbi:hypothetical protein [Robiginitalea sp. SC105]|uniref:hypothetical protein n=1 Tax=Robiginitalea sp. SC105 TaxID=2762332 RepID=UPI001C8D64EE|nr:hypothetical protein [Robiginitalea sp. SC105]
MVQDAEARTYNQNGQSLGFTNGQVGVGTATPTSTLSVAGSFSTGIRSTNVNTTLTASDFTLVMYSLGLTINLPAASTCAGRIYILKNLSGGENFTSLNYIAENGSADNKLKKDKVYWLQSDGVNWQQISRD